MTRVVVVGAASLTAAAIAARLREAGAQVVEQETAAQGAEMALELQRLPDVEPMPFNIISPSQIDGLSYGPQRNRKKGKPARW